MKLKDAVYYAAMFLQLGEVCEALESDNANYSGDVKSEIDLLVRCANLVIGEAASDYLPLKTNEKVTASEDGEILYSALTRSVIDVYSVKNAAGKSVPVKKYFDRVILPAAGEYVVEYSYMPEFKELDDALPYTERLSARVIAYGTACEYCIISGMSDEAALWDKRYKDGLNLSALPKEEKRVAKRRWL